MREVILVELLLVLDRFILPSQLRALSQSKMFLTTSSKRLWNYIYLFIYLLLFFFGFWANKKISMFCSKFGPVQDVRIPCQQKRMFGFVTFVYAETVKQILAKGNPHFVCGARVLVKPYREKSRLVDR